MALFCNTLDVSIVPAAVIICPLGLHWVNDLPVSCRRTLMSHKHVENLVARQHRQPSASWPGTSALVPAL